MAVVVPAYNEERKLEGTLSGIPDFVDDVVVVDDGSSDGTPAIATAHAHARPGCELVRHEKNRGVGAAIGTGYVRALERGSDVIVVMAGDGQMDPRDLPGLLVPIARGEADYAKGNRFLHPEVWRAMPLHRQLGNIGLSLLTRLASGYWHLFDSQCGFTAISRTAACEIDPERLYPRYGYPNDLLARLSAARMRVVDVPVRAVYGPSWSSGISWRTVFYPVLWVVARSLLWRIFVRFSRPPSREKAESAQALR